MHKLQDEQHLDRWIDQCLYITYARLLLGTAYCESHSRMRHRCRGDLSGGDYFTPDFK